MFDRISRVMASVAVAGAVALATLSPAQAADTLRVGKSVLQNFGFMPLDIGVKYGLFKKEGIEVEPIIFAGGAKLAQAVVAGAVDIALSAGPAMAFTAKGAPYIAVATISESMKFMAINISSQSKARTLDDLKGKKIGVTSPGSLTYWMVGELNKAKGWSGADRATAVVIGGNPAAEYAALKTGHVDAAIGGIAVGYELEERHSGRALAVGSDYIGPISMFVTFASKAIIEKHPDAVRRFVKDWNDSVAYMKSHKAETVELTSKVIGYAPAVSARTYDDLIGTFSDDGKFTKAALDRLLASFVELKTLPASTDMTKLYDARFVGK
jgi:NitT/TauT family transport system substrate-binding protein